MRTTFLFITLIISQTIWSQKPKLVLPIGHTAYLLSSIFSPDNKRVITIDNDHKIIMWDAEHGLKLCELKNEKGTPCDMVVYNTPGSYIIGKMMFPYNETVLPVWDAITGESAFYIEHKKRIVSVEFSHDGQNILSVSQNGEIKLWNISDGSLMKTWFHSSGFLSNGHFSPDGQQVIVTSIDNTTIYKIAERDSVILENKVNANNYSSEIHPDGKYAFTLCDETRLGTTKLLSIWDLQTKSKVSYKTLKINYPSAFFSQSGNYIIVKYGLTSENCKIFQFDLKSGKMTEKFTSQGKIKEVFFSRKDEMVGIINQKNDVQVWDLSSGKKAFEIHSSAIHAPVISFSNDCKKIGIVSSGAGKVYDAHTGKLLYELSLATQNELTDNKETYTPYKQNNEGDYIVRDINFNSAGDKLVTSCIDNRAIIWSAKDGKFLLDLSGNSQSVLSFINLTNNNLFDSRGANYYEKDLWDLNKGTSISSDIYRNKKIKTVATDNSLSKLAIVTEDPTTIEVWDIQANSLNAVIQDIKINYSNLIKFSPDGKRLITYGGSNIINIWDAENGKLIHELKGHDYSCYNIEITSDNRFLVSLDRSNSLIIWDLANGEISSKIEAINSGQVVMMFQLTNPSNYVLLNIDKTVFIYDINTGKLKSKFRSEKGNIRHLEWSPDNKRVLCSFNYDNSVLLWDIDKNQLINTFEVDAKDDASFFIGSDWKYLLLRGDLANKIDVYNLNLGNKTGEIASINTLTKMLKLIRNGNVAIVYHNDGTVKSWDLNNGSVNYTIEKSQLNSGLENIFPDDSLELILLATFNGNVKIFNAKTGKLIHELKGHSAKINDARFLSNGRTLITSSEDHTLKIWDIAAGKLITTFLSLNNGTEYFNQIPSGYYQCTSNAAKLLHYVTKELKVITFEQLDVKYNRPDKVLEVIGCPDTALISSYRKAYFKRITKLRVDTTVFRDGYSVPEADFSNRDKIASVQENENLELHITALDSIYVIDRLNVWVNEVPLFGLRGISIKGENKNHIDTTLTINLSQGKNRVETSIINVNGTESYRIPLNVNYSAKEKQKKTIHFIGIGIDKFSDSRYNLKYSSKDIRDLCLKFKDKYGDNITIDTLFDANVTVENVRALKEKLLHCNVNDQVIASYSGHGLLSRDYDYYLSTYSINFEKPEEHGLSYDELEHLLDSIPARQKLLLIDACHSGEVDKDELLTINKSAYAEGLKGAQIIEYPHQEQLGLKNSFELMQSLFVNVGKNTGTIVISAAAGNQFALESGKWNNGVFTYAILETFDKHPTLKISELKKIVGQRVEELTNGLQKRIKHKSCGVKNKSRLLRH